MELIIAPHADDEMIGCFTILKRAYARNERIVIFCPQDVGIPNLLVEQYRGCVSRVSEIPSGIKTVHAPDPFHEFHPEHRQWGMWAESLWRKGQADRVCFYTVNMQAPYTVVLPKKVSVFKRELLDLYYPEKSDLWKDDHKYWLFEGHCEWLRND